MQVGRRGVFRCMACAARAGDGQDTGLCQQERQHHLGYRSPVLLRNAGEHRVVHQAAPQLSGLCQRAVSHDRDVLFPHQGQQIVLDAAAAHIVKHLVGCAVGALPDAEQFPHIRSVQVGNAPGADQAVLFQFFHAFHGLGQRHTAPPVQQIQVQIIGFHPHQRVLAADPDIAPARIERIHLADHEQLAAVHALDGLAHQLLSGTVAIHFSGVDQIHAGFHTGAQSIGFLPETVRMFAQVPGALADRPDAEPGFGLKQHLIHPPCVDFSGLIVTQGPCLGKFYHSPKRNLLNA